MLEVNQIFSEKYKILHVIGKGGMGRVYLAEHITLKNKWAVKEMLFDLNGPIDLLAEPNILKQLDHPALPRIVDIVEENNTLYIIMDYIDGVSLKQALGDKKKFSEAAVIDFGKQLCEVFIYLHNHKPKPIIYRDMKPDNVMLTEDGKLKVIDFGIAREFKEDSVQDTVLGFTKGYAAPEQQNKETQSDARTDIYSLGVTLYHLVTGKSPYEPPYDFTKVRDIDASLSEGIEFIIRKCVQPNPEDRYQSAEQLLHAFNNIYKLNSTYKSEKNKYMVKKTLSAVVFLGCIILTTAGFKTMATEKQVFYSALIDSGVSLVKDHKFEDGLLKLKQAQDKLPKNIDSYREIAKTYLLQQDYDKCISYLADDIFTRDEAFMKNAQLLYILGTAYYNQNQFNNASTCFRKASSLEPGFVNYKRDLAVSLGKENKIADAEKIIKDIESDSKNESVTSYVQGEINSVNKKFTEAIKDFEDAIDTSKDDELKLKAYKSIANIYKNYPESFPAAVDKRISILEKASNDLKELNDIELLGMQGDAYHRKALEVKNNKTLSKEFEQKSLNIFLSEKNMGYKTINIYCNISGLYRELGDFANSEKTLKEALEVYPSSSKLYSELATLYNVIEDSKPLEKRDYSMFVESCNKAIEFSKDKEKDPQLAPILNLISELKAAGWIK